MSHSGDDGTVDDLIKSLAANVSAEKIGVVADERELQDLSTLAAGKAIQFRHDCGDAAIIDAYCRSLCVALPSVYRGMYVGGTNVPELLGQTLLEWPVVRWRSEGTLAVVPKLLETARPASSFYLATPRRLDDRFYDCEIIPRNGWQWAGRRDAASSTVLPGSWWSSGAGTSTRREH